MNKIRQHYLSSSLALCILLVCNACQSEQKEASTEFGDEIEKSIQEAFNPEDYPLILRRTTLIVRDIEKSLALYKDAIGMETIYDNIIKRKHPTEEGEQELRLVFLKANHAYFGVLGLLEYDYKKENKVLKPIRKEGFTAQNSILLFNTHEMDAHYEKIKNTPGVEIITEPSLRKYPGYDGKGVIEVKVSTFYDPDGFLVEYNQPLSSFSLEAE
ncbi:MAG: VOC family protein [Bacteroidota bacterium]